MVIISDPPQFIVNKCACSNTICFVEWQPPSNDYQDLYILEADYVKHPSNKNTKKSSAHHFIEAYRGRRERFMVDVQKYNQETIFKVYTRNIVGRSKACDVISLNTSRGKNLCPDLGEYY